MLTTWRTLIVWVLFTAQSIPNWSLDTKDRSKVVNMINWMDNVDRMDKVEGCDLKKSDKIADR